MTETEQLPAALAKIEQAIAALSAILSGDSLAAALAPLLEQRTAMRAQLVGDGAAAQGDHATALGAGAVQVQGSVGRDVLGAGAQKIVNPDPAQAAADRAQRRYLKRVQQQCNVLPLAALGGDEGVGDEVSLEQVYVALDTTTPVPLTDEEKAARQKRDRFDELGDARPLAALEAATQARRLALLGDPGGGKSTFVRQLAARTAVATLAGESPFPEWETGLIPVLVTLRELAPRLAALDFKGVSAKAQETRLVETVRVFLTAQLDACKAVAWDACLEDVLLAGNVLLIFDGLDEVAEACRARVRRAVDALLHAYPRLRRVIITCRVRSYTGAAMLPGFTAHTLAPFDEDRIEAFVAGWYQAQQHLGRVTAAAAKERARDLQQAALSGDLRTLASNPMLLTTMALIHQREVGLPKERVRLYSLAVQVLLTRWQQRKGLAVSPELATVLGNDLKLRSILERLAYAAHQGQEHSRAADLQRKDLLEILEDPLYLGDVGLAAEFLDYVDQRAGLLVGQGGDDEGHAPKTYAFPHRTFQEYLAGCYMAGQWDALDVYWRHAGEGDAWYLAALLGGEDLRYNRRSVKELLNLAYDLLPEQEPDTGQAWRATLWSGQLAALFPAAEIRRVMQEPKAGAVYLSRLIPRLVRILQDAPLGAVERAEAGKTLGQLGDPRPGVGLREEGLPEIVWCEVPAGPFLMGSSDEDQMAYSDEKPQHTFEIPAPYYISRYSVTNAQYAAFVQAGGYTERRYWTKAGWECKEQSKWASPVDYGEPFNLPNHPVVGVSWYEAVAFCRWLETVLKVASYKLKVWRATGVEVVNLQPETFNLQLPSEAEWEKAARGGLPSPDRSGAGGEVWKYPWGNEIDPDKANYGATGIGTTSAVGCFPAGASPYGVLDLSGNVWEWCRTKWGSDYKQYRPADDLEGTRPRVLRGGAFDDLERLVRCASRYRFNPYLHYDHLGFRLVLSPSALYSVPLDSVL